MSDYELYHYGIKGMKWGIRRTAAQLGHKVSDVYKKYRDAKKAKTEAKKKASRSVKDMTDAELREKINRLTLERNVLDLERQVSSLSPKKISVGKKIADSMGNVLLDAGQNAMRQALDRVVKSAMGPSNTLEDSVKRLELEAKQAEARQKIDKVDDWYSKRELDRAQAAAEEARRSRQARYQQRKRRNR